MLFPLTIAALAALDAHATYEGAPDEPNFAMKQARLTIAVGAAFAADTAGYNRADLCADLCAHAGGLAWVRALVARGAVAP